MVQRKMTVRVVLEGASSTVLVGAGAPVAVQSMTNTPTEDVEATAAQAAELARAGSEIVRVTVNTTEAARAVPRIVERLQRQGLAVPVVGDFHFNGHKLLAEEPACARALSKFRINPGNTRTQEHFDSMIEAALAFGKPVRIGVNGGSVDMRLLEAMRLANDKLAEPEPFARVFERALVQSALQSARRANELGLGDEAIVLSAKVSSVASLVRVYRSLSEQSACPLHLGLTEAGTGLKGEVASAAGLSILLAEGIGDTVRVSVTPAPGQARTQEVRIARTILQSLGLRAFAPTVTSCPGCGRTASRLFEELAHEMDAYLEEMTPVWSRTCAGFESMRVAVMGCVVNGPGESRSANIGISLPGAFETPNALVFEDGRPAGSIKGDARAIALAFKSRVNDYVLAHYAKDATKHV